MNAKRNLLLVEDDIRLNETLHDLFTAKGFDVDAVNNGHAAQLKLVHGTHYDLVICDMHVPEKTGFELLTEFRSNPAFDRIPFVIITADPVQELKIKSLENGVNDYIHKPFSIKEVMLKVENMLKLLSAEQKNSKKMGFHLPAHIQSKIEDTLFSRVEDYLGNNVSKSISIDDLAEHCGVSRSSLDKKIRKHVGLSTSEYIKNFKLHKAHYLLENSQLSIKEISQLTGFNSLSYFSTCFTRHYKKNPNKVRSLKNMATF